MTWTRRMGRAKRNPSRFLCAGDQSGGLRFANPPYALVLPAADGAGLARPGLDARVARLRVERVAVTPRQPGAGGGVRLLDALLTGANCVSGPSRFGESTAWERSRPRNSLARYSSASAAPPHIRSPVHSADAIAVFRTIAGPPEINQKVKL